LVAQIEITGGQGAMQVVRRSLPAEESYVPSGGYTTDLGTAEVGDIVEFVHDIFIDDDNSYMAVEITDSRGQVGWCGYVYSTWSQVTPCDTGM
jgi:hypothetical protein